MKSTRKNTMNTQVKQNKENSENVKRLFESIGVNVKSVTMTRVTIGVELHGQDAANKVATILNSSGDYSVRVIPPHKNMIASPSWRVGGTIK